METIKIYKCFCNAERLRILNLLKAGPLCVCHLMDILDADQVKISKHLRYMKDMGMVTATRHAQWMVYALAEADHPLLVENLKCLQDVAGEDLKFGEDLRRRARVLADADPVCAPFLAEETTAFRGKGRRS